MSTIAELSKEELMKRATLSMQTSFEIPAWGLLEKLALTCTYSSTAATTQVLQGR